METEKITFRVSGEFRKEFKRLYKKYKTLPDDLRRFQEEFSKNPSLGTDLGDGYRKIRMSIASKGKGKSGGARIITYDLCVSVCGRDILLVAIYDKSEIGNISENFYREIVEREKE